MYRMLQHSATSQGRQQQRTRSTRSNPGSAPDAESSCSTTVPPATPQREIHSAPARATSQGDAPRATKFYSDASYPPPPFVHDHITTTTENAANELRNLQKRLLKAGVNETWDDEKEEMKVTGLQRLDRRAVVNIYDEALAALGKAPSKNEQIVVECTRKTRVVLGMLTAEPQDEVFHPEGQLLKPLEPQYAEPRIRFTADGYGYRAQWRLDAWRRDGWPRLYPMNAIEKEAEVADEKLVGRGAISDERLMIKMHEDASWEEGDRQTKFAATQQANKKKNLMERPQKVAKKNIMTVMQPRQKVMQHLSARPHHDAPVSVRPRTNTSGHGRTKKKSGTYRRIVVDTPPKKREGDAKAARRERVEVSETSTQTTSNDGEGESQEESEDEEEWE